MTWYFEQRSPLGRWTPCSQEDEPQEITASGRKIVIRAKREIEPCFAKLTLRQLEAVYSPDGPFSLPRPTERKNHD
jgi:hypothetical protein